MRVLNAGISYSRAHRYPRICFHVAAFHSRSANAKEALIWSRNLLGAGYPAIRKAWTLDRKEMFAGSTSRSNEYQINLVLSYSQGVASFCQLFNGMQQSSHLWIVFAHPPIVVCRRGRNFRDSSSDIKRHTAYMYCLYASLTCCTVTSVMCNTWGSIHSRLENKLPGIRKSTTDLVGWNAWFNWTKRTTDKYEKGKATGQAFSSVELVQLKHAFTERSPLSRSVEPYLLFFVVWLF